MSKNTRGKGLPGIKKKKGKCPVCGRDAVKLLYTRKENEKNLDVCKQCKKS